LEQCAPSNRNSGPSSSKKIFHFAYISETNHYGENGKKKLVIVLAGEPATA
jgi:hypothetical protein